MTSSIDPCQNPDQFRLRDVNTDPPSPFCDPGELSQRPCDPPGMIKPTVHGCRTDGIPSQKDVAFIDDRLRLKTSIGHEANCDPMQNSKIIDEFRSGENSTHIYRYSRAIYGANEAVRELFTDIKCIDVNGEPVVVPIIWGTQERAVAMIIQSNVKKDNSLTVQRIQLPYLAIHSTGVSPADNRYIYHAALNESRELRDDGKPGFTASEKFERDTVFGVARGIPVDINYQLTAWTLYLEDMDQIVEQVMRKFSRVAYIRIQGIPHWETIVRLESISTNLETEVGDKNQRVIKFQFELVAETFIPQPIVRRKAVLKTRVDMVEGMSSDDITKVVSRIENSVKGF